MVAEILQAHLGKAKGTVTRKSEDMHRIDLKAQTGRKGRKASVKKRRRKRAQKRKVSAKMQLNK